MMKNFEIKELAAKNIHENILDDFNRYQEVRRCYRNENGNWVLKKIGYIEDWDKDEMNGIITDFKNIINGNGYIFCAYENARIIGFAVLLNRPFGSKNQYIQLSNLQVSYGYRHGGIGKKLFEFCAQKTKDIGVEKIYISANTSEETQRFYLSIGCKDAAEI
ncbi:MAG: GNAT family N-acetyltransferase, partial [Treponema sp.]|nr:GNAT family N-acetyltransferase [Treponema sp.]